MNIGSKWTEVARALERLLQQRHSYEDVIRDSHWAEGPIYVVSETASRGAGCLTVRALEWLLGWLAVLRGAEEFCAYSLPMLRPRSVLLAVTPEGKDASVLDSVRRAARRGVVCYALTRDPDSPISRAARGNFTLPACDEGLSAPFSTFLEETALAYISFLAARLYNPRHPELEALEKGFAELPAQLEWISLQLPDALRSLLGRLKGFDRVAFCGEGFHHDATLLAARLALGLGWPGLRVDYPCAFMRPDSRQAIVLVSGSSCKTKKTALSVSESLRKRKMPVFSITDHNDHQLAEASDLAIILPPSAELTGSLLALACLDWLVLDLAS